jgi:hypothetical protein
MRVLIVEDDHAMPASLTVRGEGYLIQADTP